MKEGKEIEKLATDHVDWYLAMIRPQLIEHFIHGYKHAMEECIKDVDKTRKGKFGVI